MLRRFVKTAVRYSMLLLVLLSACSLLGADLDRIEIGQTMQQVSALAGEPDEIQEFRVPETPVFGPQEGLYELLDPGTEVVEWQYQVGNEITYVWFAGSPAEDRALWTVVLFATYPADAIF